jgi:hypothetical protein
MNIYEALDRYNLISNELTPQIRYEIAKTYDQTIWIKATKLFLKGIGSDHDVSGSIVKTLYDLCNLSNYEYELTPKQMIYLTSNLIDNWNQVNYEIRSLLYV